MFPSSSPFISDRVEAFADFAAANGQPGVLRAKASVNAFYSLGDMAFSAVVHLNRRVQVNNPGATANIELRLIDHGIIISGGGNSTNSMLASAREDLSVSPVGASPLPSLFGEAIVLNERGQGGNFTTVNGEWSGWDSPISKPAFYGVSTGVEIDGTYVIPSTIAGNTIQEYDITFDGRYEVRAFNNESSGYSLAEADFSNTGNFDFRATDPITGQPRNDVTFTFGQVPEPGVGVLLALGVCAAGLRRKRLGAAAGRRHHVVGRFPPLVWPAKLNAKTLKANENHPTSHLHSGGAHSRSLLQPRCHHRFPGRSGRIHLGRRSAADHGFRLRE